MESIFTKKTFQDRIVKTTWAIVESLKYYSISVLTILLPLLHVVDRRFMILNRYLALYNVIFDKEAGK